jgi:hypothetical protein
VSEDDAQLESVPVVAERRGLSVAELGEIEQVCLQMPQVECPLQHRFAPGVYMREITMPAGTFVIGHQHRTEHFNVILKGRASVIMDGVVHDVVAPCTIKSGPGVRKALYIWEDMVWATIHPTVETDLEKLDAELVIKSDAWLLSACEDAKRLKDHLVNQGRLTWHG